MNHFLSMSIIVAVATSCGAKTPASARIRDGNDVELGDCTDLGKVEGTASQDDKNAEAHAKNAAREQAAAMGATTIRWIIPCCTSVEGEAFRCDTPDR